jgi:hypothetical protein
VGVPTLESASLGKWLASSDMKNSPDWVTRMVEFSPMTMVGSVAWGAYVPCRAGDQNALKLPRKPTLHCSQIEGE